jgi:ribonuclease BN (tRNA processing enzyme)
MNNDFHVTFWGVRGSHPVPGKPFLHFGGNTTCLEVTAGGIRVIIDAGTGIIGLGKKIVDEHMKKPQRGLLELTILFTHLHHDHTQGLPFFIPLYLGQSVLHLFGPRNFGEELCSVLERSMVPPNFPIDLYSSNSVKNISTIHEKNIILLEKTRGTPEMLNGFTDRPQISEGSVLIRVMNEYSHPSNGVFVYRIEYGTRSVVFCTDVEGYMYGNAKLIQFAKGTDLLIHDAQYSMEQYTAVPVPKQGYGHSIPEMAIDVAKQAQAKNLALTHHDPASPDALLKKNETKYKKKFHGLFYAREGLTFSIP